MSTQPVTHIVRSYTAAGERRTTQHPNLAAAIAERQYRRDNLCDFRIEIVAVEPIAIPTHTGPVIAYRPADAPAKRPTQHRERVRQ